MKRNKKMQTTTFIDNFITPRLTRSPDGRLLFDGFDCEQLARQYGTPLYLMSEDTVRANCRRHLNALRRYLGADAVAAYAGKALSCRQIYRIIADEGMYADAVSSGELYTAHASGFDMSHIIFHGNNKTPADIAYAQKLGVGLIVADSSYEVAMISRSAASAGIVQPILLRLTPGIDAHTHQKISTGQADSKFGIPIDRAPEAVAHALSMPGVRLDGIHCHIGSQISDPKPFCDALEILLDALSRLQSDTGFTARIINLGGGFGVRYVDSDTAANPDTIFSALGSMLDDFCRTRRYPPPAVMTEPGRSIVADAGITLYTVGNIKQSGAGTTYVSVDGGMADNPRYALYCAPYTAIAAVESPGGSATISHTGAPLSDEDYLPTEFNLPDTAFNDCAIVGRCCESGDILVPHAHLPRVCPGDIIAVLNTGAYNYSMASNYNRLPRPPIVMLHNGKAYVAVRRETPEDVAALDC